MLPISQTGENQGSTETNGHGVHEDSINGKNAVADFAHSDNEIRNGECNGNEAKIVLPTEMASMVSLRTLIGKLIRKGYADLMTLTDTLPSRSDVDKKRQILNYATFMRKQLLKLQVLVKWADNADDIQMCQNIMAYLANQNQIFQTTTQYLHKIHSELPAARIRNFDILTAVDALTTGTYQRMPTKYQDMIPPTPLTDEEVLDTFKQMNDVIRMRILTKEVLPSPMRDYRIESGRISFFIKDEFNVALTLLGPPDERQWWIVSLDVLVKSTPGSEAEDVNITLNDVQKHNLKMTAQKQLVPPPTPAPPSNATTNLETDVPPKPLFFPLVNLYDYLHLFCLNMQIEIIYMQATMLSKTRWLEQLGVQMDPTRTKLTLIYWQGGSSTAHWAHPQHEAYQQSSQYPQNSTTIEMSISNENEKTKGPFSPQVNMAINVRDELKGLIQEAGLGASVTLASIDEADKPKVYSSLKYPKTGLDVLWGGIANLHSHENLMTPSNLNVERVVWHVTRYHALRIVEKFRELLIAQESFLNENGLYLADGQLENDLPCADVAARTEAKPSSDPSVEDIPTIIVRYRHRRYINITVDVRTGRVKVREAGYRLGEGDAKMKELEERLNTDPANISRHLLWLRSEVVIREIVSLAKQLSLQPFHPSQMSLRPDDFVKLFGDLPITKAPGQTADAAQHPSQASKPLYPSHCVFLRFAQFEDWYLVLAILRNEIHACLCCINTTYDQTGLFQLVVDLVHVNYEEMWKEHFLGQDIETKETEDDEQKPKRRRHSIDDETVLEKNTADEALRKRRRTSTSISDTMVSYVEERVSELIDHLSIDLRFMAKLDSSCRAYITNRKVELQLLRFKGTISYSLRPLLKSLPTAEAQIVNHPAANKMEVICVSQRDLLKTCFMRNVDDGAGAREIPVHMQSWINRLVPRMRNDVVIRASGWWACGRNECFVVIQDKFNAKNIPLGTHDISDHISLDETANVLSFTYTDIDSCIDRFLTDWERIYMMANLARQVPSKWLKAYEGQLKFEPFNTRELKFIYAEEFTCTIRWDSAGTKGGIRQYLIDLGKRPETVARNSTKKLAASLLSSVRKNPHARVASFLQDILNDKKDLVRFIQALFTTLPLMYCLEELEVGLIQEGSIGELSIIPRAVDAVRIVYSSMHALDIRFIDPKTICVSDAAFHHIFYYSSSTRKQIDENIPPQPYSAQPLTTNKTSTEHDKQQLKPIKVAQQFKFSHFKEFDELLNSLESWIFNDAQEQPGPWYVSGRMWADESEPSAVSFKHGFLCSASLCRAVLLRLKTLF